MIKVLVSDFNKDPSEAFRLAEEHGGVTIVDAEGKERSYLSIPRAVIDPEEELHAEVKLLKEHLCKLINAADCTAHYFALETGNVVLKDGSIHPVNEDARRNLERLYRLAIEAAPAANRR